MAAEGGARTTYVATGSAVWRAATCDEQVGVICAFGANRAIECAEMVNAGLTDAHARAWGEALSVNSTLTSLNLESNGIHSAGVEAIAAGIAANTSLRQLKLANQQQPASQAAELALARALEDNHTLITLTTDEFRSIQARDLMRKYLERNGRASPRISSAAASTS